MIIPSADALAVTGTDPTVFNNVVARGHYVGLPPAGSGRMRFFGRDDIVALSIFNQLLAFGVIPKMAAKIASDVRAVLRRSDDINVLHLIRQRGKDGKPKPVIVESVADDTTELFTWRIAACRRQAEIDIAAIQKSKGAS